jgi:uncharacterized protein
MKGSAASYDELRDYVETVPLVDCHDHSITCGPAYKDPIHVMVQGYFRSDIESASSAQDLEAMLNTKRPLAERWPIFEKAWKRTCHTGYAQVPRRVLDHFYGEQAITLDALERISGKLLNLEDPATFEEILDETHIVARIEDVWPKLSQVLDGALKMTPRARLAVSLPGLHRVCTAQNVYDVGAAVGQHLTTLDEYLEACRLLFEAHKRFGAVTFKDQSAYTRTLDYGNPTRDEAEHIFNWIMADPRRSAAYPDGVKPLDDYLFHAFMRMARDLDLPVQLHTGHMAGIRNEIVKTNAVWLTSLIELHQDVRFDLFHTNWPYSGELLFLCKNYPNVHIDFCWANIIDPIYCQNLFKQALSAVPHGKIHGYGSDFGGAVDQAWAHASIARDNIAIALSDLVAMDYLGLDDAKQVARDWLFENANAFFRLGLSD